MFSLRKIHPLIIIVGFAVTFAGGVFLVLAQAGKPLPREERVDKSTERVQPEARRQGGSANASAAGGPLVVADLNQNVRPENPPAPEPVQNSSFTVNENRDNTGGGIVNKFDAAALREGTQLVVEKKFSQALAKLKPIEEVGAGNLEFDLAYGIALLETGSPKEAAVALRRAVSTQPSNMLARAQLARALASSGSLNEARTEIEVIRARQDLDPDVRGTMDRNLKQIDQAIQQRGEARKVRLAQTGPAAGNSDKAAIQRAATLVRDRKPDEALTILTPLESRLRGNPDFDYVYGVAALDAGRPAQAVGALRRAVEARPGFHVARAEYGRALAAMGDLEGAKREFAQVRDVQGLPAPVRDAMGRQVIAIDSATAVQSTGGKNQPQTRVTGYIEQALGYDNNVNGGPSAMTISIPGIPLGSGTLDPAAGKKESPFYEIAGGLSIAHAIDNQTALFANLLGNLHLLFTNNEFNTALIGGEFGIARQTMDGSIYSLAVIGQAFWLDESVYRAIYGIAGQWRKKVGEWDANVALTWLGLEYPQAASYQMTADRYTVSGGIGRRLDKAPGQPSFLITLSGGKEITRDSAADHFSYNFVGVRYSSDYMIARDVTVFAQLGYEYHSHDEDYPLFFTPRKESLYEVLLGFEWRATERISFRPTLRYSRTASNVDLFDTERWVWSAATRYSF